MGQIVFLIADKGSWGGLKMGMELLDKEKFLLRVDKWNEKNYVEGKFPYWQPDYRYGQINGSVGAKLKDMYLTEFEDIFTPEDIERLGGLLLYRKGEYRQFRKEVYMKYGKLFEPQQQ